jgi:hypothetical protein
MITGNETAYPVVEIEEGVGVAASDERGLTIRQQFAAMAMQGFCANDGWAKTCGKDEFDEYAQRLSEASVLIADALINELNKER